MVLGSLFFS